MKLEIRKIAPGTLVFSAYPLVLFALSLARALIMPPLPMPDATAMQSIMQIVMQVLTETAVFLVLSLVTVFIYNVFCSLGIKGIRFDIEEVEVVDAQEGETK